MKQENQATTSRLQAIAEWVRSVSYMLFVAAFVACILDVFFVTRGALTVPVLGYLVVIGAGAVLQVLASAIPNLKFGWRVNKPEQVKPYRIDN